MSETRPGSVPERILRLVEHIATAGVWFGGALLLFVAILVGIDVVVRKVFALTLGGADEMAGYALAIASAWAFSFTLLKRSHIRIDFVYNHCPAAVRYALDLVALVAIGGFAALLAVRAWGVLDTSLALNSRANTPWGTPLWMPQTLWFAGLAFLVVTSVVVLVAACAALSAGNLRRAREIAGMSDTQEEVEAEMREAERQLALSTVAGKEDR